MTSYNISLIIILQPDEIKNINGNKQTNNTKDHIVKYQ